MSEGQPVPAGDPADERDRRAHEGAPGARPGGDGGGAASPSTASAGVLGRLLAHPTSAGRYRLHGEIARGGMGAILRVWDEDLRRDAAMKVALAPDDGGSGTPASELEPRLLARFLEEAQVTGQLEHPGIVPVHELGVDARGQAFFTMRLVRGRTLERVFDDARRGVDGWSMTRAVGVLLKVCEAMEYAHSKHVLHRDLKPANVMVGEFGEVYVMDWGLVRVRGTEDRHDLRIASPTGVRGARVVVDPRQDETGASDEDLYTMDGDVLGTPSYMAPEQARGELAELDDRADVYSVGAMLYRLASGRAPYAGAGRRPAIEVLRDLLAGPPEPLARLAPDAPAELVAICERAMAREREARYPDMHALAEDVRAFLEGRVVAAFETGAWAEARKWVRRNRPLAAALAAAVLALVAGLVASLHQKGRADDSAALAEARRVAAEASAAEAGRQARIAEEVNAFLADDLFASVSPERAGFDVTVREVLDAASETLGGRFQDEPLVEARLRSTLGTSFQRLGEYESALPHLERALALTRVEKGEDAEDTLLQRRLVASVTADLGRLDDSLELLEEALPVARAALGDEHRGTLALRSDRANLLRRLGRYAESYEEQRAVVEAMPGALGEDHPDLVDARNRLALVLEDLGRGGEAERIQREVLAVRRRTLGDTHPSTLTAIDNLAANLAEAGRFDESEALHRETLASIEEVYGERHPYVALALKNLGVLYLGAGRTGDAAAPVERCYDILREALGEDHPSTLQARNVLGNLRADQGRFDEAFAVRAAVLEDQRRVLGPEHPSTLRSLGNLAVAYKQRGDYRAALELELQNYEAMSRVAGPDDRRTLIALENLGGTYFALGERERSLELTLEVLAARTRVLGADHPDVAKTKYNLAMVRRAASTPAEALAAFEDALAALRAAFGERSTVVAACLREVGDLARAVSDPARAAQAYAESLAIHRDQGEEHPLVGYLLHMLARSQADVGELERAIATAEEGLAWRRERLGNEDESTLSTLRWLAVFLRDAGRFEESEERTLELYDRVLEQYGPEHSNTVLTRAFAAELYDMWGKPEQAAEWRE